jgi:superfamily II DNA or RNA helicase
MLKQGIYEQVINNEIKNELSGLENQLIDKRIIDPEEAPQIIAKYISGIVKKGLESIKENHGDDNLDSQIAMANKMLGTIKEVTKIHEFEQYLIDDDAEQLLAFYDKKNTIYGINDKKAITRPDTSISDSSLFTGAVKEPSMFSELRKETLSCDRVDMLVSFVKWSGLRLIIDELRSLTDKGGQLRVITTSYMGATDVKAIEELCKLKNTEIKISYDTKHTRLHAKTYVFYRGTGFSTAYVGSSNLSNAAMSSGLEWNVKITEKDLAETLKKISATFDSYWNSSDFRTYTPTDRQLLVNALKAEKIGEISEEKYSFDIKPYPYQQEILDKLDAERKLRGYCKNLVVAPTGVGKTVVAAFDYKRFCKENVNGNKRILFVAHREEILKQSLCCFRGVLRDANFGDLFVGNNKPSDINHLFISIQTFNSVKLNEITNENFYDMIIIDEFHRAAADSYQILMNHYKPKILLGLTATPERHDGKDILQYFDNRITAEMRLPEAIDRKLLCPFQYFGVSDSVDLSNLKWSRGGYDSVALSNLYTGDSARADMIIKAIHKYVTDINDVKGLAFCVSVEHAKFMAENFNKYGIPSISLDAKSSYEVRRAAPRMLTEGKYKFIFVVDLYNEGVDIPEINTVLFLRPTESLTVFLQQLGRGLRTAEDKECLTVLDFVGQANKKYNFEEKINSLMSSSRGAQYEIKNGFPNLPKGCYIKLEKKAQEYILDNIKKSFGTKLGLISKIANFSDESGLELNLNNFVNYHHMDIRSIYKSYCFSRLCVEAGIKEDFKEEVEEIYTKAFSRICSIDSRRWIRFLLDVLVKDDGFEVDSLDGYEKRMLQMFQYTIWQKSAKECGFKDEKEAIMEMKKYPVLFLEMLEILEYCYEKIDFVDEEVEVGFECPLDLHCNYLRDQILVAMDYMKPSSMQTGVKYFPNKGIDLFLVTLNKAQKDYSPTTMYNDYSVNEELFHWQSQNVTSPESTTGQRYIGHVGTKNKIMLFVREYKTDASGTSPYTYLGLVDYVSHSGSKPMNILWRLRRPIPARFISKTNKLVAG